MLGNQLHGPLEALPSIRAGYEMGPWSIEEEGAYRHSKLFNFAGLPFSSVNSPFGGQRNSYALLTNVLYNYALPELRLFGVALRPSEDPWRRSAVRTGDC